MEETIIYKAIVGSQAYGTSTPESDIDYKGIYIQSIDDLIGFNYKEQINVTKDETYYELRRFLELLKTANPTVLEMLFMSDECIVEKHPIMDILFKHRHKFLTKQCRNSFGGYAIAQIKKAGGLDKKMNWEKEKMVRKTPLDFIYVHDNGKTISLQPWLEKNCFKQEYCGLVVLNHMKDMYSLFYNYNDDPDSEYYNHNDKLKYNGIIVENSNSLRLSSIPINEVPKAVIYYNMDGYSTHCKDYKEYQEWLNKRNTQRYVDSKNHGQMIDGKNLLHCRRLLDMAMEIAIDKTINVKRPNGDNLIDIRKGNVVLADIVKQAEIDIKKLDELYRNSDLPDSVDDNFVNQLLLEMRHAYEEGNWKFL